MHLGLLYKIHLNCGAFPKVEGFPDIGTTGDSFLSLIQNVDRGKNVELYMDNFFTHLPLINKLRKHRIHLLGRIWVNNAPCFSKVCMPDNEPREMGTTKFVEYMCTIEGSEVPWF